MSYAAPGYQISRYALRDDRTAFLLVFARTNQCSTGYDQDAQKRLLCQTFSRDPWIEWPEIESRLKACDDLYFDAVSQVVLPSWFRQRTVLVGDAAYCPSLLAGEGAAFAMAGAYILAVELERAGGDHASAFARYERSFMPFIERKQRAARNFAGAFAPQTRLGLFVRDQVLRLTSIPGLGGILLRRFFGDEFALPDSGASRPIGR